MDIKVESSWNVMVHGDAWQGKWRGNWRMEWVASTLQTTSENNLTDISTADAHNSATSSRLNWRRFVERRNLVSARGPSHFKRSLINNDVKVKGKGIPPQAEVAVGIPGRLRPRIFSTFGTTRVAGRQPNAPAAFTPGEISGTHFQRLSRPQGTWFSRKEPRKKSQVTTGNRSRNRPTSSATP